MNILWLVILAFLALSHAKDDPAIAIIDQQIVDTRKSLLKLKNSFEPDEFALAESWQNLGLLLQSKDVRQHTGGGALHLEILDAFEHALEHSNDKFPQIVIGTNLHKGMLLKMMGKGKSAMECYDLVISLTTSVVDKSNALFHKGDAYVMMGEVRPAISAYRESMRLTPSRLGTYLPLVECYKELGEASKEDWKNLLNEIEDQIDRYESGDLVKYDESELGSSVYWAMFSIAEKIGQYPRAWKYLTRAHREEIKKRPNAFDEANSWNQVEQVKTIFKDGMWPEGAGMKSRVPIFIVGMMRSGSTLLETMLDAHPDVWGMGEDSVFNGNLHAFRDDLVQNIGDSSSSPNNIKALRDVIHKHGNLVLDRMTGLARNDSHAENVGKSNVLHVVDKMLFNYRNIGFIHMMFPNAVILHTMRDPMDTMFSCYKHKFDDIGLEWSLHADQLAAQYAMYVDTMAHFRQQLPGRVIDIRYEALIANPEKIMREVLTEIGLPWDDRVLQFHTSNRIVHTHSQAQVRQGLYTKSIGAWLKYADQLKPMIAELKKRLKKVVKGDSFALPYKSAMNWNLSAEFDYGVVQRSGGKSTSDKPSNEEKVAKSIGKSSSGAVANPDASQLHRIFAKKGDTIVLNSDNTFIHKGFDGKVISSSGERAGESISRPLSQTTASSPRPATTAATSTSPPKNEKEMKHEVKKPEVEKVFTIEDYIEDDALGLLRSKHVDGVAQSSVDSARKQLAEGATIKSTNNGGRRGAGSATSGMRELDEVMAVAFLRMSSQSADSISKAISAMEDVLNLIESSNLYEVLDIDGRPGVKRKSTAKSTHAPLALRANFIEFLTVVHYGMATSYALQNRHDKALISVNALLQLSPHHHDGRVRRSEILGGMGQRSEAIIDLSAIIDSDDEDNIRPEVFSNRGVLLYQENRFVAAYKDFLIALKKVQAKVPQDPQTLARAWNYVGKCEKEFGDWSKANVSHTKSIAAYSQLREAYMDRASALIDASFWRAGLRDLDKATAIDPAYKNALGYKGLLLQNVGRTVEAIQAFEEAVAVGADDTQCLLLSGVTFHGAGQFTSAIQRFDQLMAISPNHHAWYKRELAAYHAMRQLDDLTLFNQDSDVVVHVKEGLAHKFDANFNNFDKKSGIRRYRDMINTDTSYNIAPLGEDSVSLKVCSQGNGCISSCAVNKDIRVLLNATAHIGKWIQLDNQGFLPNKRQHKMFGLAVLDMAQTLRHHIHLLRTTGKGLMVPNSMASQKYHALPRATREGLINSTVSDEVAAAVQWQHDFDWRDFMDIAIKWRATSEPNDIVWWIDGLPDKKNFQDRVGLNTYMQHGVNKVVRYYPYKAWAFNITRDALVAGQAYDSKEEFINLSESQKARARRATTFEELYEASGNQPFFAVAPCRSQLYPDTRVLNGTRITLTKAHPEGWDFGICAASTPERFAEYEEELEKLFAHLIEGLLKIEQIKESSCSECSGDLAEEDASNLADAKYTQLQTALKMFYFWVNHGPITRGSSATGHMILYAAVLASGDELATPLPKGKQLDFEAMFAGSPSAFLQTMMNTGWVSETRPTTLPSQFLTAMQHPAGHSVKHVTCDVSSNHEDNDGSALCDSSCGHRVHDVFRTFLSMYQAINLVKN